MRWDWGQRTTLFDAAAYDAEVARLGAEHDWETAERRAGRLILTDLSPPPGIEGVRVRASDGELEVWLEEPGEYQILVPTNWDETQPDESVAAVRAVLAGPAEEWPAEWHAGTGGMSI